MRAARQLDALRLGERTVAWGHSQGGHAALWTAIAAPNYAADVGLVGVAALAPASDLRPMIDKAQHLPVGRIMSAFILRAYSEAYPDVAFDRYVGALRQPLAHDLSGRCLAGAAALFSAAEAVVAAGTIFSSPPSGGRLGAWLAQNTPDRQILQPVLIAQGLADPLVLPPLQEAFVRSRCAAGQAIDYRRYPGLDHLSLVAPDSPLTDDLVRWTRERFQGRPAPTGCGNEPR